MVKVLYEIVVEMMLRLYYLFDMVDNYVRFIMRKLEVVKIDLENVVMILEFYVCCLYNLKVSFFYFIVKFDIIINF